MGNWDGDKDLDSFKGEDWRGWVDGKYDNRYGGKTKGGGISIPGRGTHYGSGSYYSRKRGHGSVKKWVLIPILLFAGVIGLAYYDYMEGTLTTIPNPFSSLTKSESVDNLEKSRLIEFFESKETQELTKISDCILQSDKKETVIITCGKLGSGIFASKNPIKTSIISNVELSKTNEQYQVSFIGTSGQKEFFDLELKSIQNIPQNIQDTVKTAKDIATKTSDTIQKTVTEQIKTIQKTAKTIPETKITIPKVEIPKYEPSKQYSLQELRQIALNDINKYRKEQGVGLLVLGSAKSSQLYSEELLNEGCIHHISDRGEGPMLRYQNNNDQMYLVAENIAGGSGTSWNTPNDEVVQGNYRMMFEDADSNWGHKRNILDSQHQSVSIGIAYDSQRLIMVQDFESVLTPGYQYDPSSFMTEPVDQRLCW